MLKKEAHDAIEGAKKLADEIETKARRTAAKISKDITLWGRLSGVSIVAFGNSGLLPHDEDTIGAQKLSTEAIAKLLASVGSRK